jgi:hypothetical protein
VTYKEWLKSIEEFQAEAPRRAREARLELIVLVISLVIGLVFGLIRMLGR